MKVEHEYAQVLRWIADGEPVQAYESVLGEWLDRVPSTLLLDIFNQETAPENFRIKPRPILINGVEVPEPLRVVPEVGTAYWMADTSSEILTSVAEWDGDQRDLRWLRRGLCHPSQEAAEVHARALLSFTEVTP
ncbi:hypothetical protein [Curvibacter lanceolatus]|uniref:hypothetical protein n=1 Tax=Curvibacter lanceolatus TaxID=86182 RepID=UPI0004CED277|nr:hypothetical protein [Curvibacter lanceolatus]